MLALNDRLTGGPGACHTEWEDSVQESRIKAGVSVKGNIATS